MGRAVRHDREPRRAGESGVGLALRHDPERERSELAAYLGDAYDEGRLRRWREQLEEEVARVGDEATLYRTSEAYLYNLAAFAMTGTKDPYLSELVRAVPRGARLLDYGCGIGSDGLLLLEAGYRVEFADFESPSTRYLRWRLQRRSLGAVIHNLDAGPPPGGYDLAFAFDVIEHADDPEGLLGLLEAQAGLVLVNFLESAPGETVLHRELDVPALLARISRRRLRRYRRYHGRSHLVLYDPRSAGVAGRLRSGAVRLRGAREHRRVR